MLVKHMAFPCGKFINLLIVFHVCTCGNALTFLLVYIIMLYTLGYMYMHIV